MPQVSQAPALDSTPGPLKGCRICGAADLDSVLSLGHQPWGNDFRPRPHDVPRYPLDVVMCHRCALVQLGYTVPKEVMFAEHAYLSGMTTSLRAHFAQVATGVHARLLERQPAFMVDIGGNDGTDARCYQALGWRVLNVESGVKQAALAREQGIETVNAFFDVDCAREMVGRHGTADVVSASGVFFHLEKLHSVTEGITALLAPQGVFVVQFIYLLDMLEHVSFDNIYHEHLLFYSLQTLGRLLRMYGLEIFDAERAAIHGGSVIAYAGHCGAHAPSQRLQHMLERERHALGAKDVYRTFAVQVRQLRDELERVVRGLAKAGHRLYAYGAPVKGTTLLNYCGLDVDVVSCAVEINPFKCGTYYPGTAIPIVSERDVAPPDYYLLLAWNFKDEILRKEISFREQGGRFIVPIPWPAIVGRGA